LLKRLRGVRDALTIGRDTHGVAQVQARCWEDAYYGLGWLHGRDRGTQVALMRVVAQGRLCELVQDTPAYLELDAYFRRMGFAHDARLAVGRLERAHEASIEAYCRGVSEALRARRPWSLRLLGIRPPPYTSADVLLALKFMAFSGLAEVQRVGELFVVEAVRRGIDEVRLRELLPELDALDCVLLRGLRSVPPLVPGARPWVAPSLAGGSNAWAVSGARSASAAPLLCNDPHLEVNRLPAVVYEVQLQAGEDWVHGASIPGLPALLTGRNRRVAWGVTYGFGDVADFFVERCRNGRYLREGEWHPFRARRERLLRKGGAEALEFTLFYNEHGLLEGDPREPGDYLCWGWSGREDAGAGTLGAVIDLVRCRSVAEAQRTVRSAELPNLHMVFADAGGDIGYQMVGRIPRRRAGLTGLAPQAGWVAANDWRGWLDPAELPCERNPPGGCIVSANEGRRAPGGPLLATLPQPLYRCGRIAQLLAESPQLTPADMQALQQDVYSPQAERLLPILLPHVPPGPPRRLLEAWDLRYDAASRAASLFEALREEVVLAVFGSRGLGRHWLERALARTPLSLVLHGRFDAVLCREDSRWLPASERTGVLASAVAAALEPNPAPWGERNALHFRHLVFGGRLPRFLRADRGPYPMPGSRATILQCAGGQYGERRSTFAPCYRFVTDLAGDRSWTSLPGGAKESWLSPWYANELPRWLRGEYKQLSQATSRRRTAAR
jgi:penicillin G amidase